MTFAAGASASGGGRSIVPGCSVGAAGGGGAGSGGFGLAGAGALVVASDSRMREIGGRTVVFFLVSPSAAFFCGCFLSIKETLAAAGRDGVAGFGAGFAGAAV